MIQIKKFKLIHVSEVVIEFSETIRDEEGNAVTVEWLKKSKFEVHEDLLKALKDLLPHMVALCEFCEYILIKEAPELLTKGFDINQVSWGGNGEYAGVTLCGKKELKQNRVLNLVSPFCMFESENPFYDYGYELQSKVAILEHEIVLYLGGKHAPSKQIELDFSTPTIQEDAG